ncbi:DNA-binding response regulator, LytR/AlgR family [Eubacterium aggregans]|uniref:Stage 0 sporulation protein A homolog n=1 Tax=Eubacterium aggregans TaxID=81409 RepID=A0A1H3Y7Q4_9FIRM|nr:LytTR family DNA-binding domain-containing protein [Eubacterium aggregans]SEA06934.1 DNA-binding response regulator, LytR/AlgR family [Eubacterium aggregans]
MNIVICDDDAHIIATLKSRILPLLDTLYPNHHLLDFSSGNDLLVWYTQNQEDIDILYIDIEMPGHTGLSVVKKLRQAGSSCIVIFVSSYESYVFSALDYSILHYLLKPLDIEKIDAVTKRALDTYKADHQDIEVISKGKHILLSVSTIIYVESKLRKVFIHTTEGSYPVNMKIGQLEEQLSPYSFVRTHKSYLVNLAMVIGYEGCTFMLTRGYRAEIGHARRSDIIDSYNAYLRKKLI